MTKHRLPTKINSNTLLTGLMTGAALLVGAACGTSSELASPSTTPVSVAPVAIVDPDPEEVPVSVPIIDDAETSSTTDAPLDPEPPPPTEVAPATAPVLTTEPGVVVAGQPDPVEHSDNACGPTRAMPATATDVSSVNYVLFGHEADLTIATSYQDAGQWYLRYENPLFSNEIMLDSPAEGSIEVLTGIEIGDVSNENLLVRINTVGDVETLGIFGNHDGCLIRFASGDPIEAGDPIELFVGSEPGFKYGVECYTDEYGSFLIASSATDNGDGTWNVYGTYFTHGDWPNLEAGDGAHDFAIASDHAMFASFEHWKC
jgi:hypothetical protein